MTCLFSYIITAELRNMSTDIIYGGSRNDQHGNKQL